MTVELVKKDIINLLRGVEPSYSKMRIIEDMGLGYYTGGFDDSFNWNHQSSKCWDKYSKEDLFKLYKELTINNKVIKAPEIIYLATTDEVQNLDNSFIGIAHNNPDDIIEPIEYVRKDAFIEKACVKLKKLMYNTLMFQGRLHREEVIDNFVEDFKNYMKGE